MPKYLITCHATATISEDWLITAASAEAAEAAVEDGGSNEGMVLIDEITFGDERDRVVTAVQTFANGDPLPTPTPGSATMKEFIEQVSRLMLFIDALDPNEINVVDQAKDEMILRARAILAEVAK